MRVIPYVEMRRSYVAPWARRAALLSFWLLVVGVGAHWYGLLDTPSFFIVLALTAGIAGLALALAALGMPKVWYRGFRGGADLATGIVVATFVLVPFAGAAVWALTHAPLTDIATDLDDPPAFVEVLDIRTADMNPLSGPDDDWKSEQLAAYPAVTGRRYEAPIETVREVAERVFDARGWPMLGPYIVGTGSRFSLETTVTSPVLALPSDLVLRMTTDGEATLVDVRSASRYGSVDFGQNADWIVGLLNELDVAMATRAPAATGVQPAE